MNPSAPAGSFVTTETVGVRKVHGDLSQEIITITVDKLKLILFKYLQSIEDKRCWVAPFGIFLTIAVVLITSDFKNKLVPASTWQAFFMMAAVLTGIWLIRSLIAVFRAKPIDDVVTKIKEQTD